MRWISARGFFHKRAKSELRSLKGRHDRRRDFVRPIAGKVEKVQQGDADNCDLIMRPAVV